MIYNNFSFTNEKHSFVCVKRVLFICKKYFKFLKTLNRYRKILRNFWAIVLVKHNPNVSVFPLT